MRLADRLRVAHRRNFVGRTPELALFNSALAAESPLFYVLYIFGPGGIGKTSLLREFVYQCEQHQVSVIHLDGRDIEPTPESFLRALQAALGLTPPASPVEFLAAQTRRSVLLIDTYEMLTPLDRWLRQYFLPQLSDNVLTVLAGRDSPALAWRTDPGWQAVLKILPLRNLNPQESQTYLTNVQIPLEQHQQILSFTYGHPLALSLVADLFAQRQNLQLQFEAPPDMIKALLERLVQKVPSPAHRTALEACAIVRVTTEALLAEMLAVSGPAQQGVRELFEWLRQLSFIETNAEGLFPHDLIREALVADLCWRNPDWYAELHRRARSYYTSHLQQTAGRAQQQVLFDYVFLHRDNPMVRPFFEWQSGGSILTDTLKQADIPSLMTIVAKHEGDESARLAAYWCSRQPQGARVFRDIDMQPSGLLLMVSLDQIDAQDLATDPAIHSAFGYLQQRAPLKPGQKATLFRFWLARDTYQSVSPIQSLIFIIMVQHYITTPNLAYTMLPCAEPEFWGPMFAYADLQRVAQADFEIGGRRYGMYGHDWRVVPPLNWLALLANREIAIAQGEQVLPPAPPQPLLVLSQPEFEAAVKDALHNFLQPDMLQTNPLTQSRLVLKQAGANAPKTERAAVLKTLLQQAADSLQNSPRELKFYRALYHTYFQPASTQEQTAELLNLPFSTFRRHLKTGLARTTQILWQQEIDGLEK